MNEKITFYGGRRNDELISLTPENPIYEWGETEPTEEGYTATWERYEYIPEGGVVRLEWSTSGRDCDGPLSSGGVSVCPVDELTAGRNFYGRALPKWRPLETWQRDPVAEAAGY